MIESNTVLVLGAGASAPFGFPTGQALKDQICNRKVISPEKKVQFSNRKVFSYKEIDVLEYLGFKVDELKRFRVALINSGRPSVDAFLEYREDFLDLGKAAIALALLPYETTSRLFSDWIQKRGRPDLYLEGNWYDLLFGSLSDGVPFENFGENKLSIITFNYDRSLEHYLFTSLKNSYNKADDECGEKLRKIEIIHVHGSLGRYGWQPCPPGLPWVPYDSGINPTTTEAFDISPTIVKLAAESIKIVHENVAETPEFLKARALLLSSTKILFLGFGYHPVNLKRLGIGSLEIKHNNIWGTSYRLSLKRKQNIGKLITTLSKQYNYLKPENVYNFLYNHVIF